MCGIAGFIDFETPVSNFKNILDKMASELSHRGPDSRGTWFKDEFRIGLAHSRLSILDLSSKGSQPMISKSGRYITIYNGEIYNHKRIRIVKKFSNKRDKLKKIIKNKKLPLDERFQAQLKLAKIPRNSARNRVRNRCAITGRSRGNYRKFGISRIKFREMAHEGLIPGVTKASW